MVLAASPRSAPCPHLGMFSWPRGVLRNPRGLLWERQQTPCGPSDKEEGGQGGRGQQSSESQEPERSGATAPKGFSPQPLHFPGPASSGGKSAPDSPPPENLLSVTALSSGQPSQFSQPPSCITYSCEPLCEVSLSVS